ncbi:MAG: undecaprenyldiphospho-muramoylpentapeptide beta-N-acetylglucosaminyltransferase [candidate division KSB1 bacterium]|nr:undecaprenyldiphospho-muramoylpentapeptide beta-N-acetylglucosaminyltransferase [candidate division KSB1 bacterium]MDZ7335793.1 undecaprenyldiphospho-muramoylpentapeptide beta-N-acetylglucosaminyltransferase [candidate division KSB1 bacterium]MDZ7358464.1 undecaprenyldiphospho-muramoylpentapeptide beta-N-acetylglucosaminyltransferase [candidate division KSB1 bacterium]
MSEVDLLKIVISGGGTGGHIYPGIAIANKIKQLHPKSQIVFVGVKNRIEAKIVPKERYPLKTIYIKSLPRKMGLKTIGFLFSLFVGLIQSIIFLLRYKPKVVVGTGGYVSYPVVYAAHLLKIPTLIQEQNSYPGIATKKLASKVDEIHLAFEEAARYLSKAHPEKFRITGNPIRLPSGRIDRAKALEQFGLEKNKRTLLLFGGSQGAAPLNEALLNALPELSPNIQILWQTGELDYERVRTESKKFQHRMVIQPFFFNMADAYAATDLALCRAGAITIAELVQAGVPAIFVPLPHAAEGHQEKNARVLVAANASAMILQQDLTGLRLKAAIEELIFDDVKLTEMRRNLQKFHYPDAAGQIAQRVIELAGQKV